MQSIPLLLAAFIVVAQTRVTFLYSEVLQRSDMTNAPGAPFNCDDGCTVYLDPLSIADSLFISKNGVETANFSGMQSDDPSMPLVGIDLEASSDYKLVARDNADFADFSFYAVSTLAPNYDTPVYAPQPNEGVVASVQGRYATFLSSAMAMDFFDFKGDFPDFDDVTVYSTGFDALGADVYGKTTCSPVYKSRSQQNAAGAMLTIISPIVTVYFNVEGDHSVSVNTTSKSYSVAHKNASSIVYMSPGYVGCPFVQNVYSTVKNAHVEDNFLQAAYSIDIFASYLDVNSPVQLSINEDSLPLTISGSRERSYDKGVYHIQLAPWPEAFSTVTNDRWRMQIDFTYESDLPTTPTSTTGSTTTVTTPPTTTSSSALNLLIAIIVVLLFV